MDCGKIFTPVRTTRFGIYNSETNSRRVDRFWDEERMAEFAQDHPKLNIFLARDERWEHVKASVGQHQYDIDFHKMNPPIDICEFSFEVPYNGTLWWCKQLVPKIDLVEHPELYGFILNEMVKFMDQANLESSDD